jgi:gas vesicle protein
MKLSSASLALMSVIAPLLPHQSSALSCGIKGVTKSCIGETDIRYDPDVSLNIKDQNDFWKGTDGLFIGEQVFYSADGEKQTEVPLDEAMKNLGTYDWSKIKVFGNVTIVGTRYISNQYFLFKHNGDSATPGFPGLVRPFDSYYTGTFEKDGSIQSISLQEEFGQELIVPDDVTTITPIAGRATLGIIPSNSITATSTTYCLDDNCDQYMVNSDVYTTDFGVSGFARAIYTRVDKDTWMSELNKALDDFNIPSPDTPFTGAVGFDGPNFVKPFDPTVADSAPECYTLVCPTEDYWKTRDPALLTSPYVEPDGVLTGGFIAGVTIGSIIVACAIFYFIYKRGVEARERRVKAAVFKSIAQTMNITASKSLSPQELESMFQKIDVDNNGNLSKAEIKGLVEDAGVAEMADRDYDVLFSSIDLDGNGTLDFAEFCAFFTSISVEEESDQFVEA